MLVTHTIKIMCTNDLKKLFSKYREPESQQTARPFGSSMAERQRFGCLDTWPYNCKQTLSLRSPIGSVGAYLFFLRFTYCTRQPPFITYVIK